MSISLVGRTSAGVTNTATVSVPVPDNIANGDVLLLFSAYQGDNVGESGIEVPSGFTSLTIAVGNNQGTRLFIRNVTNASEEPENYTITRSGNPDGTYGLMGFMYAFRGVDTEEATKGAFSFQGNHWTGADRRVFPAFTPESEEDVWWFGMFKIGTTDFGEFEGALEDELNDNRSEGNIAGRRAMSSYAKTDTTDEIDDLALTGVNSGQWAAHAGVLLLAAEEEGLTFTSSPTVTARTASSYTIGGTLAEEGEVYAVAVLAADDAPTTEAQIVAGHNGDDQAARGAGNGATAEESPYTFSFNITGTNLGDNLTHNIHIVGRAPEPEE